MMVNVLNNTYTGIGAKQVYQGADMNKLKISLRLILKIPLSIGVVLFFGIILAVLHLIMFFEWLYDSKTLKYSIMIRDDYLDFLKEWFTTI